MNGDEAEALESSDDESGPVAFRNRLARQLLFPIFDSHEKMSLCNDRCRDISLASHDMIMTQTLTVGLSQIFYSVIFSFYVVKKLQAWTRACTKCFSEFS